jgi:hypothetical protein
VRLPGEAAATSHEGEGEAAAAATEVAVVGATDVDELLAYTDGPAVLWNISLSNLPPGWAPNEIHAPSSPPEVTRDDEQQQHQYRPHQDGAAVCLYPCAARGPWRVGVGDRRIVWCMCVCV